MTSIDIKIDVKKLTDYSASNYGIKDKKTLLLMIESFSHYILGLYKDLIIENIYSRRYKGEWEPVNEEGYIEYLGITPTIPIIGLISSALEVAKIGNNFYVRFAPSFLYPGTDIPLVRLLRAIEYGTSDFTARPILVNNVEYIRNHIISLWKGYLVMRGVV